MLTSSTEAKAELSNWLEQAYFSHSSPRAERKRLRSGIWQICLGGVGDNAISAIAFGAVKRLIGPVH